MRNTNAHGKCAVYDCSVWVKKQKRIAKIKGLKIAYDMNDDVKIIVTIVGLYSKSLILAH